MLDFLVQKVYAYSGETTTSTTNVDSLLQKIIDNIVTPLIYLLLGAAIVYFIYGTFIFIKNADNPTERQKGYQHMIWGVVGIFIMVSAKGLISIILSTLGL